MIAPNKKPAIAALDFKALLDASPNPYLVLDRDLNIATANKAYLASVKRQLEDIVGRWAWDAFPADPETVRQAIDSFERVKATRRPDTMALLRFDTPRPRDEGGGFDEHWWTIVHSPVLDEEGEVAFILQNPIEVTELKQLRESLQTAGSSRVVELHPAQSGIFQRAESVYRENLQLKAEGIRMQQMFAQAPSFMAMLRSPEHRFEFVNPAYSRLIGHRDVIGRTVAEALPDAAAQGYVELLDQVYSSGVAHTSFSSRYAMQVEIGGPIVERYVDFVFQPIRSAAGEVSGVFVEGTDVTDRTLVEHALRETEEKYRSIVSSVDIGICIIEVLFDNNGRPCDYLFLEANPSFSTQSGIPHPVGMRMKEIAPQHEQYWFDLYGAVATTGESVNVEQKAEGLGGRWFEVHAIRIGEIGQHKVAVLFSDVTGRKKAESERALLSAEMAHRLKNSMAMVQAIATQTLRSVTEKEAVEAFHQRLHALSTAHNILLRHSWESASITDLLREVVGTFSAPERVRTGGPDLALGPRSSLSLSLLLHELATNATKYGALSVPDGAVSISWKIVGGETEDELELEWLEAGGPPVTPPSNRGFGSRLIRMGLVGTGGVGLSYDRTGVRAVMKAPLSQIRES